MLLTNNASRAMPQVYARTRVHCQNFIGCLFRGVNGMYIITSNLAEWIEDHPTPEGDRPLCAGS
jgi:hypothetical protein